MNDTVRAPHHPPAELELRPEFTTHAAIALCEKCGGGSGCERSLYGLVWAEVQHAIDGCNGAMKLTKDGVEEIAARPPMPEPPPIRIERD